MTYLLYLTLNLTFGTICTGSGMGSLHVELSSDGGMTWDSTWTVSGDQGVDWAQANIDVSAYAATGVTVKITGNTGSTLLF